MPPRPRLSACQISRPLRYESSRHHQPRAAIAATSGSLTSTLSRTMATTATATTAPPSSSHGFPAVQPPSHRRPEFRKSQLIRQYASLLRTMPLMLFFQHHNLKSNEWVSIRRELAAALRRTDEAIADQGRTDVPPLADTIKIQVIHTSIFEVALRVVEFFRPAQRKEHLQKATSSASSGGGSDSGGPITSPDDPRLTHDLSRTAYEAVRSMRGKHEFATLLTGPIAVVTFPVMSPEHLKAALSILAPKAPVFPAPKRRTNPGYHELSTQGGLQKLMLLGARVEGKVFDDEETRWIGSIEGGLFGLRSQLVSALQGVGASVTGALEGASKSLYLTLESRRSVLEEEQTGEKKGEEQKDDKADS